MKSDVAKLALAVLLDILDFTIREPGLPSI
jgi:hypothetical protein